MRLMQPRKRRADILNEGSNPDYVAADARPPVVNKEMSSTTLFGANNLKEGSNPDYVGPGWQASRTKRASEERCQGTALSRPEVFRQVGQLGSHQGKQALTAKN
uniref:Uncharacterized protein n=1 Tax=Aegilops tauschii TaxID=37682 RepID=M8BJY7_AEGTA